EISDYTPRFPCFCGIPKTHFPLGGNGDRKAPRTSPHSQDSPAFSPRRKWGPESTEDFTTFPGLASIFPSEERQTANHPGLLSLETGLTPVSKAGTFSASPTLPIGEISAARQNDPHECRRHIVPVPASASPPPRHAWLRSHPGPSLLDTIGSHRLFAL